jgi:O-antigen/teichoic acid export membrane protein
VLGRFLGAQWLAIAFNGAISFGLSVLIARTFGPQSFGVYAAAISLGGLFSVFVGSGFNQLLQREATRPTPELASLAQRLPGFAFGHALLVVFGFSMVAVVLSPFYHLPTLLAALGAFGVAVMGQFGLSMLRGRGRFVKDAGWQISNRLLTAAGVVLVILLGASQPWQVLTAQAVGAVAFVLFVMAFFQLRPAFKIPVAIYRVVLPFVWLDLATVVYFRSDVLLMKLMGVPNTDVGYYGVAYRIIEAFLLLASPVSLILFRKFRIASGSTEVTIQQVLLPAISAALIGLAIAVSLWFLGDYCISLAYGHDFYPAGRLLGILGISLIFAAANGVLGQAALALGIERSLALSATCAAIVNVTGNLIYLPRFGVAAAAWMTVVTEVVLGAGIASGLYLKWKSTRSVLIVT